MKKLEEPFHSFWYGDRHENNHNERPQQLPPTTEEPYHLLKKAIQKEAQMLIAK
ncbi:hypothetical protein [Bacillus suaedae]|uniref:Uncharacterized protein n=1 Tax=Halalkalibacter suaedae TaxID=2822140 RepID=A0A940WXE2_9BACI|nr:hypothetical protein [Bacillus suaedae]MBP3949584.1 hypothetical protein [Bacillus suaedae]